MYKSLRLSALFSPSSGFISLLLCLGFALAVPAEAADSKMLQIKGSDTMVNLAQAWSEEFMRAHPKVSIAVTGGGSGTGIASIISGTCDLAQASRSMTPEEVRKAEAAVGPIKETVVAYDGIVVAVHPTNSVFHLTLDQLADIFSGKISNWKEIGGRDLPILLLSRDRNSGTHVFFLEHVLRRGNAKGPEEFAPRALMMPSNQAIAQEIKSSEAAIGYVGLGYVSEDQKIVAVTASEDAEPVLPEVDHIQNGSYPIARPLYFYTREDTHPDLKRFTAFVLSAEGQDIVRLMDFVPLNK